MGKDSKRLFRPRQIATSLNTGFEIGLYSVVWCNEARKSPMNNTKILIVNWKQNKSHVDRNSHNMLVRLAMQISFLHTPWKTLLTERKL